MQSDSIYLLIPLLLGLTTILQTHFVKKMAEQTSFLWAGVINNLTGIALLLVIAFVTSKKVPNLAEFKAVYLLAGLFGMTFVIGSPFAVSKIGPAKFFLLLVSAQIVFGLVWQYFVDPTMVSSKKMIAAVLVIIGAALSSLDS